MSQRLVPRNISTKTVCLMRYKWFDHFLTLCRIMPVVVVTQPTGSSDEWGVVYLK